MSIICRNASTPEECSRILRTIARVLETPQIPNIAVYNLVTLEPATGNVSVRLVYVNSPASIMLRDLPIEELACLAVIRYNEIRRAGAPHCYLTLKQIARDNTIDLVTAHDAIWSPTNAVMVEVQQTIMAPRGTHPAQVDLVTAEYEACMGTPSGLPRKTIELIMHE